VNESEQNLAIAMHVLRAATQVVDAIQDGLGSRGFTDVRPAHGFAFVRISAGGATVADVAEHLGVTKQAASQLVEQLVRRGYVTRETDPRDGRARLLTLTARGTACTRAAEDAAADAAGAWRPQLGDEGMASLCAALGAVVVPGRLRPAW
jgi:DNA-binding MarR family transcriptional regulator